LRQKAVAHLWGEAGWKLRELSHLFSVTERTMKRDLRRARLAGEVNRSRMRNPPLNLRERGQELIDRLRDQHKKISAMLRAASPRDPRFIWGCALLARLAGEERGLIEVMTDLHRSKRMSASPRLPESQPEYLGPDLLQMAAAAVRRSKSDRC
jgi:DNA-binding MarR family transcriptional regulator